MKKMFSFVFACLLAFILIGCNADEKDNKLDDNNDNVINQGSDNSGEEKLGNNENNGSNETNNENNENQDPIEVVKEDKFVMVEDDTIFTFLESDGSRSVGNQNRFNVTYDDDDVLFYCKIDNGFLCDGLYLPRDCVPKNELIAKNGDAFLWCFSIDKHPEQNNFFEAVFKKDDNIVGYAVVWCEIFFGTVDYATLVDYKCLKSVVFPKVDGEYQNVTEEDVNELINQAKNSINKEFKFNYDNCVEIDYELKDSGISKMVDSSQYWSHCIIGNVLSCTKVFNNFDDLFNSFDYLWLRKGEYIDFLDRFAGIDNLEEHKDLFELDFDKRSVIVISETKVDEIDDIKVYVDNNKNLCVRIEGKDTNYGGKLNDTFGDDYCHIREWLFIEVDKIDGLDYTDVYADIIVTNE